MSGKFTWALILAFGLALPLAAQTPSQSPPDTPQPQAQPAPASPKPDGATPAQSQDASSSRQTQIDKNAPAQEDENKKPPTGVKKILRRAAPNCIGVGPSERCWSESGREKEAKEKQAQEAAQQQQQQQQQQPQKAQKQQPQVPENQPAPRSDSGEPCSDCSTSKATQIDLSPPPGDAAQHEGAELPGDVQELHPWDPHRADKDVEVGDYYMKQRNYRGAIWRYQDALEYMPNHAVATFHLAEALEKTGDAKGARKNYEQYLKILPKGEYAAAARQALQRLASTAQNRPTSPPAQKVQ